MGKKLGTLFIGDRMDGWIDGWMGHARRRKRLEENERKRKGRDKLKQMKKMQETVGLGS